MGDTRGGGVQWSGARGEGKWVGAWGGRRIVVEEESGARSGVEATTGSPGESKQNSSCLAGGHFAHQGPLAGDNH
ncbi:hypothetical protein Pmani_026004 [Petrolisthes manimaculis]|uniref:Uncharacterized protein n=1 Tax=Petrolisthes manimaculis TaxID=1843537 RepID=A0AAE1P646_9EUCA|nr:hypothetical protein Pmani_026004 [Petrolisthes manimaculis]